MAKNEMDVKRIPAIEATIDTDAGRITLAFANGETLRLHAAALTPEIATMAMYHGLKQKLVDAAAISRNPETGRSATIEDKFEAVKAVYDRLLTGNWNVGRGEGSGGTGGLLFRALCRLYADKSPEDIKAFLEKKSDKEQAALRKNPKIAPIIEEIRSEKVKPSDDSDAMLAELED